MSGFLVYGNLTVIYFKKLIFTNNFNIIHKLFQLGIHHSHTEAYNDFIPNTHTHTPYYYFYLIL